MRTGKKQGDGKRASEAHGISQPIIKLTFSEKLGLYNYLNNNYLTLRKL